MKAIKLKDIIDEMDTLSDEYKCFLNKETGALISVSTEELSIAEEDDDFSQYPEWQQETIKEALDIIVNWNNYVELPDKFEINEYDIMERFCYSIDNDMISNALQSAIHGSGAFRRFKDTVIKFRIDDRWYKYKEDAYKEIARDWCDYNNIEYIE